MASLHQGTNESTSEALQLFSRTIELDPDFASVFGLIAFCYDLRKWNGWMIDPTKEIADADRLARRAVMLRRDDAVALCTDGFALLHVVGDFDFGATCISRALALNPNLAAAWYFGGWASANLGEPDIAIERLTCAMRLNPLDLFPFPIGIAMSWAQFVAGRYEEAATLGRRAVHQKPNFLPGIRIFAAACAMAGHLDEAKVAIWRMRELDPAFRISSIQYLIPIRRPEDAARYENALRVAGFPAPSSAPKGFRIAHGGKPVKLLGRAHIKDIIGAKANTPEAANNLLKVLRVLLDYAVDQGVIDSNPAKAVKRYRSRGEGFHTWSEGEIAQFQARHPIGSRAGLALALLLYTAQRRGDVVRMGWQHVTRSWCHCIPNWRAPWRRCRAPT
jgi:tetratricopeptide (TPR) repeat protein